MFGIVWHCLALPSHSLHSQSTCHKLTDSTPPSLIITAYKGSQPFKHLPNKHTDDQYFENRVISHELYPPKK